MTRLEPPAGTSKSSKRLEFRPKNKEQTMIDDEHEHQDQQHPTPTLLTIGPVLVTAEIKIGDQKTLVPSWLQFSTSIVLA
jgi:hypothetical protein